MKIKFTTNYSSSSPIGVWYIFADVKKIMTRFSGIKRLLTFGIVKHIKPKYEGVETKNGVPTGTANRWRKGVIKSIFF